MINAKGEDAEDELQSRCCLSGYIGEQPYNCRLFI